MRALTEEPEATIIGPQNRGEGGVQPMPVDYEPDRVRKILNKPQRAEHWFWDRYSAAPYVGCEHACHYCYSRARK